MTNEDVFVTPWANKSKADPMHSLCSYLGAFPLHSQDISLNISQIKMIWFTTLSQVEERQSSRAGY